MGLVGPTPTATVRALRDMVRRATIVRHAKPGMTGFWQMHGSSRITFDVWLGMQPHPERYGSVWWVVIRLVQTPVALLQRGTGGERSGLAPR